MSATSIWSCAAARRAVRCPPCGGGAAAAPAPAPPLSLARWRPPAAAASATPRDVRARLFGLFGRCARRSLALAPPPRAHPPPRPPAPLVRSKNAPAAPSGAADAGPLEDYSDEDLDAAVVAAAPGPDGAAWRVVYRNGGAVDAGALEDLCDRVGWPRRPLHKVEAALANSFLVATLTLEPPAPPGTENDGDVVAGPPPPTAHLVGLARCTSDGAFNATLWDVVVDPALQGRGLGKALVERVVR
jgi:GNAT superfamily N-acetyltransferase